MANQQHLDKLKEGVGAWNTWSAKNLLGGANLSGANLSGADLSEAHLSWAKLVEADLSEADLSEAHLSWADLSEADLMGALCVRMNLKSANLTGCRIYGISAWTLELEGTKQTNLIITPPEEPSITVDNLEVAQFIYLLLHNPKIRDIINTVANRAVLILGRFTKKRKAVLEAIGDELRKRDLCPIIFDFQKSEEQDIIETVKTLASMSKFVIADVTDARVIPDELRSIIPNFAIPVVPLFSPSEKETKPFASLYTLRRYPWFLEIIEYKDKKHLIKILPERVIKPAEAKHVELRDIR